MGEQQQYSVVPVCILQVGLIGVWVDRQAGKCMGGVWVSGGWGCVMMWWRGGFSAMLY